MSSSRRAWLLGALSLVSLLADRAHAQPIAPEAIPPELRSWVPWLLEDLQDRACPIAAGTQAPVCAWPGRLALTLDAHGGTFTQDVVTDRPLAFSLPGDEAHWPQGVTLGGALAPVLARGGRPVIFLPAGEAHLAGRLEWRELPESLPVPEGSALVELTINGQLVPFPRRDDQGLLWLQAGDNAGREGDSLELDVTRKVTDGVPATVTTRITLRVAGKVREVNLGKVLLDGTVPLAVTGDLPARLEPSGDLRVQARAGTFAIEVLARTTEAPAQLVAPTLPAPWPEAETWVWEADEAVRQVSVTGAPGVDPSRTSLPEPWRKLPAYQMAAGAKLALMTIRRGLPDPSPDRLTLRREIWMDVDGGGFTMEDHVAGVLSRTWRLSLEHRGTLGHVSLGGADQLITAAPHPGVELRDSALDMAAEWRIGNSHGELPAVGWSQDVQSLQAELHLPPGWRLITASGVDGAPGTWISRWDLLGFFFVLLVSAAIGYLIGWRWGALALLMLGLCYPEPAAPMVAWLSLVAALGLRRVLPDGWVRSVAHGWWWISVGVLALVAVPFAASQLRTGLHPQTERSDNQVADHGGKIAGDVSVTTTVNIPKVPEPVSNGDTFGSIDGATAEKSVRFKENDKENNKENEHVLLENLDREQGIAQSQFAVQKKGQAQTDNNYRRALQNDPHAVVQTGFGMPSWAWHAYSLSWSGPVNKDHFIHLWLLSPLENLLLSILRVLLLAIIAFRLVWGEARRAGTAGRLSATVTATVALLLVLGTVGSARADTPNPQLLEELKARLSRPEECRPDCVSTSSLALRVTDNVLDLDAEVHVGASSSWRIPGPAASWVPRTVTIDGKPTTAIARLEDGFLHVRVAPGRHILAVSGPLPVSDIVTLQLGEAPHHVTAQAPGWKVDGLTDDGRASSSIQLSRELRTGSAPVAEAGYPPWLEVTRTLDIGIPWLIRTTVHRVSPTGSPVVAQVPLLPGESVTESSLRVENGEVMVALGRDDTDIAWSSTLKEAPTLELHAPVGRPFSEVWVLVCSPVYRCQTTGLEPVQHQGDGHLLPSFRPWPGESVTMAFQRPEGFAGQSMTIDRADLEVTPGTRLLTASLALDVRSSQGGFQPVGLPPSAEIQELTVDGQIAPIREDAGSLVVPVHSGLSHIRVSWQQAGGLSLLASVPRVELGREAVNARVVMHLPPARWILMTGGPSWGPAVLFWAYLVACLVAGVLLGFSRRSPLKSWQWALLAVGLTQLTPAGAIIVVAWFFALEDRRRRRADNAWAFDARQLALVVWSIAAFVCLYGAVHAGLLNPPDMQVSGAGSTSTALVWYTDRISGSMPTPWVASLPLWAWQGVMLVWSLWLAASLIGWLKWAWRSFGDGGLWRALPIFRKKVVVVTAPPVETPPAA